MLAGNVDGSGQLLIGLIAFASTVVGGFIVGFSSLLLKQREYLNDYNKIVLQKRVSAYEKVEALIVPLKTTAMSDDRRPFHILFSSDEDWQSAYALTTEIANAALWLSPEAFDASLRLSHLMFYDAEASEGVIEFGKRHYQRIAVLREEMERILAHDMRSLHKIGKFLRRKSNAKPASFVAAEVTADEGLKIIREDGQSGSVKP
jgi:hypothetical protein